MSGSKPSRMPVSKQTSSHSVGRTPVRKHRSKGGDCDSHPQPRAEFRGHKRDPYYVSYHGSYDPVNLPIGAISSEAKLSTRNQPYAEREFIPVIESPSKGFLIDGPDWSVRARNMPIVFIKQMKEKALFIRDKNGNMPYRIAFDTLFKDYNDFYVLAKDRPKIGCVPTKSWNDVQVKCWTKLAKHIGVQYSGQREYSFPKGCLGITKHGSYYHVNKPWPVFSDPDDKGRETFPFFDRPRTSKRSDFSRIKRSLKRIRKAEITPFDFSENLCVYRAKSSRQIRSDWRNEGMQVPFQEYRESVPKMLSLKIKRPAPIPQIVLDALKRIAGSVEKILPGSPWTIPKADPIQPKYTISVPCPPDKRVAARLRVYLSRDGNAYLLPTGNDGRVNLLVGRKDLSTDQYMNVLRKTSELQRQIDAESSDSDIPSKYPATLGSWEDW